MTASVKFSEYIIEKKKTKEQFVSLMGNTFIRVSK